jgi:hypothetical protein
MTTLEALIRREASPPLKSPLPQHREAAKPKSTVAMMPVIGFIRECPVGKIQAWF